MKKRQEWDEQNRRTSPLDSRGPRWRGRSASSSLLAFAVALLVIRACSSQKSANTVPWSGLLEEVELSYGNWAPPAHHHYARSGKGVARAGSQHLRTLTAPGDAPEEFNDPVNVATPHVSLRTTDGRSFGGSLAASGDILMLGWGDRVLVSPDAGQGGQFYLQFGNMWSDAPDNAEEVARVFSSEELACYQFKNDLRCVLLNRNATFTGVPLKVEGAIWLQTPVLQTRLAQPQSSSVSHCQNKPSSTCFGIALAVNSRAIAISGSASNGSRYVQVADLVYNSSAQAIEWRCLSGCDKTDPLGTNFDNTTVVPPWPQSSIWSREGSYGDALAFDASFIAVGAPLGLDGEGFVHIWTAAGPAPTEFTPRVAQNTRFRTWSRSSVLAHGGSNRFGAALALRGRLLVVGAPGGPHRNGSRQGSVHLYLLPDAPANLVTKMCDFWRPAGDFGVSLAIQAGRGNRFTVFVGEPEKSRVYALLVTPDEAVKCRMQSIIRQYSTMDFPGDGFGAAIAVTKQFLFVGAPRLLRNNGAQNVISGLLHIMAFCSEGNYLRPDVYRGCDPCPDGQWSTGSQVGLCTSCIPQQATALQGCDFNCHERYFGDLCLSCSQAMIDQVKPAHSQWVDGEKECFHSCNLSYEKVDDGCVKCAVLAEDYNGLWIPETCSWKCNATYFAQASPTNQPDCVACSVFQQRQGSAKPDNSVWVDGLTTCEFGPTLGYTCDANDCTACPALVPHAHWTDLKAMLAPRCNYACDEGYFGHPLYEGTCETCPTFLEQVVPAALRPSRPARSAWVNTDGATCDATTWACISGTHASSSNDFCCPDVIEHSIPDAGVAPCQVRCLDGFWWDEHQASCSTCFALPQFAKWSEGNCSYVAKAGFQCSNDGLCSPCPSSLPLDAAYIDSPEACTYSCNEGFFGHPTYLGICVSCSNFQNRVVAAADRLTLPRHGFWEDGLNCNPNSWACSDGYDKSLAQLYCCPQAPDPNGVAWTNGVPCPVSCNKGYMWDDDAERCIDCPARPDGSEWKEGCTYTCKMGLFDTGNKCLKCGAYRHELGDSAPDNGMWPEGSMACGDTDWECKATFHKSLVATIPGCCPKDTPEGGTGNGPVSQCSFNCVHGFRWDAIEMTCVGCPDNSYSIKPTTPVGTYFWNGPACSYSCVHGNSMPSVGVDGVYYAYPPGPARTEECLACQQYADRMQWAAPDNSRWPQYEPTSCTKHSWLCNSGFKLNDASSLCCAETNLPMNYLALMSSLKGAWVEGTCEWRCAKSWFPTIPLPEHRDTVKNCISCKQWLKANNIESCYDSPDSLDCAGKIMDTKAETCVVQVALEFTMRGMVLKAFTSKVEIAFREGLALASGNIQLQQVTIVSVRMPEQRRVSSLSQEPTLSVSAQIRSIQANEANQVKVLVKLQSADTIKKQLHEVGYEASIDRRVEVQVSGGPGTWECKRTLAYNQETAKCCPKVPLGTDSDLLRYLWAPNGCDWTCRVGFLQRDSTSPCLNCAEFNDDRRRFKPPKSSWNQTSPDCSEWICDAAHVRSSSGFSCIPLPKLQAACSALTRCAHCVQDGDCVWCNGMCTAGVLRQAQASCPYANDASLGPCTCESATCSSECTHTKCSKCVKDDYCGWCAGTKKCMLGSYFQPLVSACPQGSWIANAASRCASDDKVWIIGLVCATGSTLLVAIMGGYVVTRVRMSARREQLRAAGRSPEQQQLRRQTQRFVSTFPTFKYNGKKLPSPSGPTTCDHAHAAPQPCGVHDEDEDPMCSICLGEFGDGDELRMLPCLHVFHVACIDEWLGISHECPLCKRSVVNNSNSHLLSRNREFVEAQSSLFTQGVAAMEADAAAATRADGAGANAGQQQVTQERAPSMLDRLRSNTGARRNGGAARRNVAIEMVSGITVLAPNASMLPAAQHRALSSESATSSPNTRARNLEDPRRADIVSIAAQGRGTSGSRSLQAQDSAAMRGGGAGRPSDLVTPFNYASADEASAEEASADEAGAPPHPLRLPSPPWAARVVRGGAQVQIDRSCQESLHASAGAAGEAAGMAAALVPEAYCGAYSVAGPVDSSDSSDAPAAMSRSPTPQNPQIHLQRDTDVSPHDTLARCLTGTFETYAPLSCMTVTHIEGLARDSDDSLPLDSDSGDEIGV